MFMVLKVEGHFKIMVTNVWKRALTGRGLARSIYNLQLYEKM